MEKFAFSRVLRTAATVDPTQFLVENITHYQLEIVQGRNPAAKKLKKCNNKLIYMYEQINRYTVLYCTVLLHLTDDSLENDFNDGKSSGLP